jgi:signal transduction histidine kinase
MSQEKPVKRRQTVAHALSGREVRRFYAGVLLGDELEGVIERLTGRDAKEVDTRELVARLAVNARQLQALYQLSMHLDPSQGVESVSKAIAETTLSVFRSDRAMVILRSSENAPEVVAKATLDDSAHESDSVLMPEIAKTVLDTVFDSGQALVSTDAPHDTRFSKSDSLVMMRIHSLMAAPLMGGKGSFGVIQVDDRRPGLRFDDNDLKLLVAIASMGSRALEHARLLNEKQTIIDELQHARERLIRSEQLGIVGRMAAGLAHEIKNQLGPLALLDILRSRFPDDKDVRECTEMIHESQRRILRLVQEMRAYAQDKQPGILQSRIPTDLGALVHGVVRFLRFDRECRDVPIIVENHGTCIADLDSDRIKQVLVNLIRNSVQALQMEKTESPRIRIRVAPQGQAHGCIEVIDNGPGISEELQKRVFEPFFTTKGNEGTGLGLDISRQIIESHLGSLTCESKLGKGTTMRLLFPLEADDI